MRRIVVGMSFAARMKSARQAAGLTQRQLGDACGVSYKTVSAWENGVAASMLAEHVFAAADALGVNARWLATGAGPREPASTDSLSAEQRAALRKLLGI